ncbi:MAG: hypothetical protein ACFFCH_06810 [Promethearchaeota archaeon]
MRFQKSQLYVLWLILILALFFANWVGLRDRYLTNVYPTNNVSQVAVGELDILKPGLEMAYITPETVNVIGGLTSISWQNTSYRNLNWETNPLIALTVGDYDSTRKGDEMAVLCQNGTLFMVYRGVTRWEISRIGSLPYEPPVWTTNMMFSGQLISTTDGHEIAIVGQYFNWSTSSTTGRIYVASRLANLTWHINQVHIESTPLICGAAGDVDRSHVGEELLAGGVDTGVFFLSYNNGSWDEERLIQWVDPIRSIAVGDFMIHPSGNEIALIRDQDIFVYRELNDVWTPSTIWSAEITQTGMDSVFIGDIDPFSPGQEILAMGTTSETGESVLVVLKYGLLWLPSFLWNLGTHPASVAVSNFDFNRIGAEVVVAYISHTVVLSVPSITDRTFRASQTVLLPALLFLPGSLILFALADYVGRVGEARRRRRALEMIAKGYVKCPICKRFIPKDKADAHKRYHRTEQFR